MTTRTGRPMTSRIRARGWLRTETPLHVGGLGLNPADVLPVALDGRGNVYVPGTTLAGVLRSWTRGTSTDEAEEDPLREFWGYASRDPRQGQASRVIIKDAPVASSDRLDLDERPADPLAAVDLDLRPSVGIDRVTGAAAPEILYFRTVVPAGHLIRLEIDVESASADDEGTDRARLGALLNALTARQIRIGAASGRGLGVVRLLDDPLDIVADRFDSPAGLLAFLDNRPTRAVRLSALAGDPGLPDPRELLTVLIDWRPVAPVMVRSGADGLIVDTLPLTTRIDNDHVTLVLPGSSVKGALRGRAEFIERTVRGIDAARPGGDSAHEHSRAFRDQLEKGPREVRALFGSARGNGAAGALRAEECIATIAIPDDLWRAAAGLDGTRPAADVDADGEKRVPALPETVRDRLADLGMEQADHVAIDRWTGGAADGLLFSVLEPYDVAWEPLRLTIDLTRLGENREDRDAAVALLLLVLRDLDAGSVPLGAAVNRGFGDVNVTAVTLTGGLWPDGATLTDALTHRRLGLAWQGYLNRLDQEVLA